MTESDMVYRNGMPNLLQLQAAEYTATDCLFQRSCNLQQSLYIVYCPFSNNSKLSQCADRFECLLENSCKLQQYTETHCLFHKFAV